MANNVPCILNDKYVPILLNQDYTLPGWSKSDIEEASKFTVSDFNQGDFLKQRRKQNTDFNSKCGIYVIPDSKCAIRRTLGLFFDPRILPFGCYRENYETIKYSKVLTEDSLFGTHLAHKFPLQAISVTISRKEADICKSWWNLYKAASRKINVKGGHGLEKGKRQKRLHIQGLLETHMAKDPSALKAIIKFFKRELNVQKEDDAVFCFKIITNGQVGIHRVLG